MQTTTVVAETASQTSEREPETLQKRIGSTTFMVSVRFSATSGETLEQKLLRIIESEVAQQC